MSKTILVVDDMESLRTMVKSYLAQEGYRVLTAANGTLDALAQKFFSADFTIEYE